MKDITRHIALLIISFRFLLISFAGGLLFSFSVSAEIKLLKNEIAWIEENPVVKFTGDPNWLPYEAFDENGNYIGIVSEHLQIISKITGLKFEMSPSTTWTESVNKAKNNMVDVLSETDDSDLQSHLKFTKPYVTNYIVIAMSENENYVENINDIRLRKIALIKNYGYASKIRRKYKDIDFATVQDIQDGLLAVSTGKVDALLCTLALCSYTISELGINNVRIVGKTEFETRLALGVQKELPVLHSILNKAINEISYEQQQQILDGWIKDKFNKEIDYSLVIKVISVSLFLIIVFVFWNQKLLREINLRKKVEEENKSIQKKLQANAKIIDQIHDSVIATDLDGFITRWNKGSENLFGYTENEALEKHITKVYPGFMYEQLENEIIPALFEKGAYDYESELLHASGRIFFAHVSLSLIYDEKNTPVGMIGYTLDVSEKIQSQNELKESKILQDAASIIAKLGYWKMDAVSREVTGSDELFYLFDRDRHSSTFESLMKVIVPEDRAMVYSAIEEAITTGKNYDIEYKIKWRDGTEKWIRAICEVIKDDNQVTELLGTAQDISKEKELEIELQQHKALLEDQVEQRTFELIKSRDEAERANQAKSEFLSSMSHELRTPLNAILGFAQILELNSENLTQIQIGNVNEILEAGHHLLNLINDVLDLAKIESGKLDVTIERVEVNEIIHECLNLMLSTIKSRDISVVDNLSHEKYNVMADRLRFKQILLNLISNAVKYNKEHGVLTLHSKMDSDNKVCICISDTGQGISEKEIDRLFNPFERLNAESNIEGTGIGLTITKHLVELMGGKIGVESTAGKGTTFWVELDISAQL